MWPVSFPATFAVFAAIVTIRRRRPYDSRSSSSLFLIALLILSIINVLLLLDILCGKMPMSPITPMDSVCVAQPGIS